MLHIYNLSSGADPGGGRTRRAPPLKLEKKKFGVKSWFFTRNTQTNFAPPSAIGRNMIFWRKIVIFHTKYPKIFRASLRSAQFKCAPPPNLKSWIRPWSWYRSISVAPNYRHLVGLYIHLNWYQWRNSLSSGVFSLINSFYIILFYWGKNVIKFSHT